MRSKLVPLTSNPLPPLSNNLNSRLPEPVKRAPNIESLQSLPNIQSPNSQLSNGQPELSINSSLTKVNDSSSTAVFEDHKGALQNQDIEKTLLDLGFIPTEKILTKDEYGNLICHFIKTRDHVGRASYVELDCDDRDGMGYIKVSPNDTILTKSHEASVIPYALKVGSFEASKGDIYGVGFECDNSVCIMSRKNPSLEPVETVFHFTKNAGEDMGIIENHYVPFPIVKMTEILANPSAAHKGIATSHVRMRNVSFQSCKKEIITMENSVKELQNEISKFEQKSKEVGSVLSSSIADLENQHEKFDLRGAKTSNDIEKLKLIRFNLAKRNDLTLDYIALCHSMKERAVKIANLKDEIKAFNDFSETLFHGIDKVLTE